MTPEVMAKSLVGGILGRIAEEQARGERDREDQRVRKSSAEYTARKAKIVHDTEVQRFSMEYLAPQLEMQKEKSIALQDKRQAESNARHRVEMHRLKEAVQAQKQLPKHLREDWDEETQTNTGKIAGRWVPQ